MEFSKHCSFYLNVLQQHSSDMTLEDFVKDIAGTRWKAQVEEYQRLVSLGKKAEAKGVKNKLPGLIVAGRCEGSHALKNLKKMSGDSMFDIDRSDHRTQAFMHLLKQTGWVKAGWRSVSHNGCKVVVRIEAQNQEEYALAYGIVAWHIKQLIDFDCDMCCKNITRPCFASYDPEAFFKPDAEVFPWRKFAEEHPDEVRQILEKLKIRQPLPPRTAPAPEGAAPQEQASEAKGMVRTFFNGFLSHNAFIEGHRNDFLLKLGRVARYKGLSDSELANLSAMAVERLADDGCQSADILARISAGYRYADSSGMVDNQQIGYALGAQKVQGSPGGAGKCPDGVACGEDEEEMEAEKLRKEIPCFPDSVYRHLPDLLVRGLAAAHSRREKDRLLVSMLVNLSGCLPGVWMNYADMVYSPHFYFLALSGSGRGKGIVALGSMLPDAIQRYLEEKNHKAEREFDEKWLLWEQELRRAAKKNLPPDLDKRPAPPVRQMVKISSNISKSQLIIALEEADAKGVIVNATELDMVSTAMHQECGKHDDVFRAAFHHEEVSSYYKSDKRMIYVRHPRLALCMAGTTGQLHQFVSSLENGMYSRIAFYIGVDMWKWKSAAPREGMEDSHTLFAGLSEEVLGMYLFLSGSPTEVRFSNAQWEEHTRRFAKALQEVVSENGDLQGAVVLRHGLIAARIAMVLTALRKCGPKWNSSLYECTDEDFHTAMDIVFVLLEHSLLLSTSLPMGEKEVKPLHKFYRIRPVLKSMPEKFIFSELVSAAMVAGISESSAKRYLVRLVEMKLVVKEESGYRQTYAPWLDGGERLD